MERWPSVNKCQSQQVCFVELHKIMPLTWMERITDCSIYFSPSVVKSNKSDLKIMNAFMFSAWGAAGPLNVLFFMETPWKNIFLLLCYSSCVSSASRSHLCAEVFNDQEVKRSLCDGWGGPSSVSAVISPRWHWCCVLTRRRPSHYQRCALVWLYRERQRRQSRGSTGVFKKSLFWTFTFSTFRFKN